jgi:hypothetical protein
MASEIKLPSAGKGEFPRMQEALTAVESQLEQVGAGLTAAADLTADESTLATFASATGVLKELRQRAEVFERRAREKDPDKQIYGPKMVQKVFDFLGALDTACEHAEELDDVLTPIRLRVAGAKQAAAAEAAAATEARVTSEREAAAAAAAARARAEEEARLEAEQEAAARAAAIAAPLEGMVAAAPASVLDVDNLGRRDLIEGLSLGQAVEEMKRWCDGLQLADALQALHLLCTNVVAHPDDPKFRTVRLLNAAFQQTVARHPGGVEALVAIGFCEATLLEEEEAVCYILEEPSLEDDFERWAAWFDGVKAHRDQLETMMGELGVRTLPAAVKGTGWNENTKAPEPKHADLLTLHGQRGGAV